MVRRRPPRALRFLTWGAAAVSAVLCWGPFLAGLPAAGGELLGSAPGYLPLITLVLAICGLFDVSLPVARTQWQVRGLDAAGAALLLLCPGPGLWLATAAAAGTLMLAAKLTSRRRWRSMDFVTSSSLLQASVALTATCALRYAGASAITAAAAGIVLAAFVRHAMAAAGVALTARRPLIGLLMPRLPAVLVMAFGNGAVGLLVGWLLGHAPLGVVGLAVPGLLVASTYELQTRRSAEAKLFAALASEQQRAAGRSLDQSVAVLMTVTARMLGGADVELILSGPEGLVRYTGDESTVSQRVRTGPAALDEPWVRQLLARGSVRIAVDDGRPSCAFSIGTGSTPRAVVVARRSFASAGFHHRDVVFARALARQAAPWLMPTAEDSGPRDPRLEVVREIARRILRSPEPSASTEWSSRLLDEVHALERAVAALLGSAPGGSIPSQRDRPTLASDAALAAPGGPHDVSDDPDAVPAALDAPAAAAEPEWTTTGRLA